MDITVKEVSKSFGKRPALRDISFSVDSGDIVCLIGPSGAGKSTLIRLLIGALPADSGSIFMGDETVPSLSLLKKLGYMPQNDALYDDLSGEDNLKFFGSLYKLPKETLLGRIDETLALTELTEDRKKIVRNYSGGMKKRLSLAIALLQGPETLLLDEPTVGIDPVLRRTIWNHFRELQKKGNTILVSTHVMDDVTECDKAALIYGGELIYYDYVPKLLSKTESGRIEDLFFKAAADRQDKEV